MDEGHRAFRRAAEIVLSHSGEVGGLQEEVSARALKPPRKALLEELVEQACQGQLTLAFGSRDAEISNAAVLVEVIRGEL